MNGPRPLPEWVYNLKQLAGVAGTLSKIGRDPVGWFNRKVALYLASGALAVIEAVQGTITDLWFGIMFPAIDTAASSAFSALPDGVLLAAAGIPSNILANVEESLGVFAGPTIAIGGVLVFLGVYSLAEKSPGIAWKVYQLIPGT